MTRLFSGVLATRLGLAILIALAALSGLTLVQGAGSALGLLAHGEPSIRIALGLGGLALAFVGARERARLKAGPCP